MNCWSWDLWHGAYKLQYPYFCFHDCPELCNRIDIRGILRKVNAFVSSALNKLAELSVFSVNREIIHDHVKPFKLGVLVHFIYSFFDEISIMACVCSLRCFWFRCSCLSFRSTHNSDSFWCQRNTNFHVNYSTGWNCSKNSMADCSCWRASNNSWSASNWSCSRWFHIDVKGALANENTIFSVVHISFWPSLHPFTSLFDLCGLISCNWVASNCFNTQVRFNWNEFSNNRFFQRKSFEILSEFLDCIRYSGMGVIIKKTQLNEPYVRPEADFLSYGLCWFFFENIPIRIILEFFSPILTGTNINCSFSSCCWST